MSGAGWLRIGFSSLPSTATHPPPHTLQCLTGHSVCIFRVCWHPSSEMVTSSMPYRTFPLSSPTFPSWLGVLWCVSQCLAYSLPCLWWPSHFFLNCLTPVCWRPLLQSNTLSLSYAPSSFTPRFCYSWGTSYASLILSVSWLFLSRDGQNLTEGGWEIAFSKGEECEQ